MNGLRLSLGNLCSRLALLLACRLLGIVLFTQTTLFRQFFFLATQQLRVAAGLFFAANQLGIINHRNG